MTKERKQKTKTQLKAKRLGRKAKGFTLLELLLVIAIIAVLAGIIMFALKPADRLREANQTKYLSNANDLEKAFNSYVVDNGGNLPASFNSLTYGYYDICRQGQSGSCVSLDELVTNGKMSSIPSDIDNQTATTTGFKVRYDPVKKEAIVYSNDEFVDRAESGTTLTEGLVGYWKMDESSWGSVVDSSGNGNNGTAINGATITSGKYGNGGSFDGINDNVNLGTSAKLGATSLTVSAWFRQSGEIADVYYGCLVSRADGNGYHDNYNLFVSKTTNLLNARIGFGGSTLKQITGITNVNDGNWHQGVLTASYDGVNTKMTLYLDGVIEAQDTQIGVPYISGLNVYISKFGLQYFPGKIDDVRIYNRALNGNEVLALYEYSPPPIAHWKFDEVGGTTAIDSSGNGLNGTLTGGPTWVAGKYGNAINFDGIDDYVQTTDTGLPSGSNYRTISAWINPNATNGLRHILHYGTASTGQAWGLVLNSGVLIAHEWVVYTGAGTIPANSWIHVAISLDSNGVKTHYINGINVGQTTYSPITVKSGILRIGTRISTPTEYFTGVIDDVRIYNYVRTPEQIIKDMNNQ